MFLECSYVRIRFRNGNTVIGEMRAQRKDGGCTIRYTHRNEEFDFEVTPADMYVVGKYLEEATKKEFFAYTLKNGAIKD